MAIDSKQATLCMNWIKEQYNRRRSNKFGTYRYNNTPRYERNRLKDFIQSNFETTNEVSVYFSWAIDEWNKWPKSNRANFVGYIASSDRLDEFIQKQNRSKKKMVGINEDWEI